MVLMAKKAEQQLNEPNKTKSNIKPKPKSKSRKGIGGRKSFYDWKVAPKLHLVADWARNGVLDNEIMVKLGISNDSFYRYKKQYAEFRDALKTRVEADAQVEAALFKNATGFYYDEVQTIERYSDKDGVVTETKTIKKFKEPDTTAQAIWLNNRRKEQWRQKQRDEVTPGQDNEPDPITKSILDHVNSNQEDEE